MFKLFFEYRDRPMSASTDHREGRSAAPRGFTLIEIMVVVTIIGLIAAMGVPTLYQMLHREGFGKTVGDFMDLCSAARARAILQGSTAQLVFHPKERRCDIEGGGSKGAVTFRRRWKSKCST